MKNYNLQIKDKNGLHVHEGSILKIETKRSNGYPDDGKIITRKVVFGRANTHNSIHDEHIGFFAVCLNEPNTDLNGGINYYEFVSSIFSLVKNSDAEVIGSVYDTKQ